MDLVNDVMNEITSYLSIKDIYHLSLTCHLYKNTFKNKIINTINDRCKQLFNHHDQEFKNLLQSTKSVLSGAFILECIHNENYDSPVHLYCLSKHNDQWVKFMNQIFGWYTTEISNSENIHQIKTYYTKNNLNQNHLKIISIKTNLLKSIKNNKDINICKNIYYQNKLYINNIDHMINKQMIIDSHYFFYHIHDYRYFQYFNYQINKSNLYINLSKYPIKLYYTKQLYKNIKSYIGPIEQCSSKYNPVIEYDYCIKEVCHALCPIYFLDEQVKHHHYKIYGYDELEIIILL